jgi:hypothetical protein
MRRAGCDAFDGADAEGTDGLLEIGSGYAGIGGTYIRQKRLWSGGTYPFGASDAIDLKMATSEVQEAVLYCL